MAPIKVGAKSTKDTFYTIAPVNWLLKIFVMTNVKRENNKLIQHWSLTENLIVLSVMLTINIFFLVNKVQRFEGSLSNASFKFTDSVQLTYLIGYAEYILDLCFVFKTRESCYKYLQLFTSIDEVLGAPDFSKIRSKNSIAVTSLIICFLVSSSLDYTSWYMSLDWVAPTLYCLDYFYLFINAVTVLDVVSNVIQIEYRLEVMSHMIEECYVSSSSGKDREERVTETSDDLVRVDQLKTVTYNKCFGVMSLSKCYLLLVEQVTYINRAYGLRIAAYCLTLLVNLIHLANISIRVMLGQFNSSHLTHYRYMPAFSTTLRIINYASVLFILVYRCEETYRQCEGIVRLIDLTVVNKKIPNDLKAALMDLRTLVLSRPIKFHGANFFTLDYPLLVSVASVIVTYTIILLQSMQ